MSRGKTGWVAVGALSCLVVGAGLERVRQAVMMPISETAPQPGIGHAYPPPSPAAGSDDANGRSAPDSKNGRAADLRADVPGQEPDLTVIEQPAKERGVRGPSLDAFRQRMEQLKKEKPEQYAEKGRHRQEFLRRMGPEKQSRSEFLASVDTQNMSAAQKRNHDKLLETLAKLEALRTQEDPSRGDPGSDPDATRHQSLRQTMDELGALYDQERACLLGQAATAAGCEGDDVNTFVGYIQAVIQSTTMDRRGGPGGFGGPPPER